METEKALNNLEYKATRALILGTTGTGKTTLASRYVFQHPAPLILIYDWQGGEFAKRLGAPLAESRTHLAHMLESKAFRVICYDAENAESDPESAGFDWFCGMVFEVCGWIPGRKLIVIDEGQELIDARNIPESFRVLLRRGRRRMIDTVFIADAANVIHNIGRNQVSDLYHFRGTDENAMDYAEGLGVTPDEIRGLDDLEFIHVNTRTGEKKKLALVHEKSSAKETPTTERTLDG